MVWSQLDNDLEPAGQWFGPNETHSRKYKYQQGFKYVMKSSAILVTLAAAIPATEQTLQKRGYWYDLTIRTCYEVGSRRSDMSSAYFNCESNYPKYVNGAQNPNYRDNCLPYYGEYWRADAEIDRRPCSLPDYRAFFPRSFW